MQHDELARRRARWVHRYVLAEAIGTATALVSAWAVFSSSHSLIAATAAGWTGEGVGFYGYFIIRELWMEGARYDRYPFLSRIRHAITNATTNLLVEFLPAELIDTFLLRPVLMYLLPQYIHPYPLGFLAGKFSADIIFYVLAIVGYETRRRWLRR